MTFLEICQLAAIHSGVIEPGMPESVEDQSGELLVLVTRVRESWKFLQKRRRRWAFKRNVFSATVTAETGSVSYASLNITSFSRFMLDTKRADGSVYQPVTYYTSALGVDYETPLTFMEFDVFRETYLRGTQTSTLPLVYAIMPSGEMALGPKPAESIVLKGEYFAGEEILELDGDEPSAPAEHHDLIAWHAVTTMNAVDEATPQSIAFAMQQYDERSVLLDRDELEPFTVGGEPIA